MPLERSIDMATLKWGLSGCGDISRKRVAPALRDLENCDFVAVNRARYELAEAFAKEYGARKWYRDFDEIIADDEIDAVYIATPVSLHCGQAVAAAEAGKHVLCEKPMAMDIDECDKMIAAARANGVRFGVAYYRHFYPVVDRVKAILESGEIGGAVFAQINAFEYFNPQPGQDRYWFMQKDMAGGGPMFDFGSHRIEVLLNVFGAVKDVHGSIDNLRFDREVEDSGSALFRFESNVNAVLNVTHAAFEPQDTFDIFADVGSIHIENLNAGTLRIVTRDGSRVEKCPPHANIHQPLIDEFADAVLVGRDPAVDGAIGREVNRIEELIYP